MNSYMSFSATYPFELPLLPSKINLKSEKLMNLLLKARTEIAELKGYMYAMPNPFLLLSPAILTESVASSKVENINTTVEEVLQQQLFPEAQQKQPNKEVLHYRDAILFGYEQIKELPISTRLILGIYQKLLPKGEGNYRRTQNKIVNDRTGETLYTPPTANEMGRLMSNWETYINNEKDGIDPLIKCAISHYQFEAIHPFKDGNGRTGRILMVLFLVKQKLLHLPILYISGYINKNRNDYYQLLLNVSHQGQWEEFIEFMIEAFYLQAKYTKELFFKTMTHFEEVKNNMKTKHKKIYSADLVELIFAFPVITPVKLSEKMNIHYTTASRYLRQLAKGRLLKDAKIGKYHLFVNEQLLNLLKEE